MSRKIKLLPKVERYEPELDAGLILEAIMVLAVLIPLALLLALIY